MSENYCSSSDNLEKERDKIIEVKSNLETTKSISSNFIDIPSQSVKQKIPFDDDLHMENISMPTDSSTWNRQINENSQQKKIQSDKSIRYQWNLRFFDIYLQSIAASNPGEEIDHNIVTEMRPNNKRHQFQRIPSQHRFGVLDSIDYKPTSPKSKSEARRTHKTNQSETNIGRNIHEKNGNMSISSRNFGLQSSIPSSSNDSSSSTFSDSPSKRNSTQMISMESISHSDQEKEKRHYPDFLGKSKAETEMQVQWEHEINRNRVRNAWWRAWHIPSQPSFHPLAKKVDSQPKTEENDNKSVSHQQQYENSNFNNEKANMSYKDFIVFSPAMISIPSTPQYDTPRHSRTPSLSHADNFPFMIESTEVSPRKENEFSFSGKDTTTTMHAIVYENQDHHQHPLAGKSFPSIVRLLNKMPYIESNSSLLSYDTDVPSDKRDSRLNFLSSENLSDNNNNASTNIGSNDGVRFFRQSAIRNDRENSNKSLLSASLQSGEGEAYFSNSNARTGLDSKRTTVDEVGSRLSNVSFGSFQDPKIPELPRSRVNSFGYGQYFNQINSNEIVDNYDLHYGSQEYVTQSPFPVQIKRKVHHIRSGSSSESTSLSSSMNNPSFIEALSMDALENNLFLQNQSHNEMKQTDSLESRRVSDLVADNYLPVLNTARNMYEISRKKPIKKRWEEYYDLFLTKLGGGASYTELLELNLRAKQKQKQKQKNKINSASFNSIDQQNQASLTEAKMKGTDHQVKLEGEQEQEEDEEEEEEDDDEDEDDDDDDDEEEEKEEEEDSHDHEERVASLQHAKEESYIGPEKRDPKPERKTKSSQIRLNEQAKVLNAFMKPSGKSQIRENSSYQDHTEVFENGPPMKFSRERSSPPNRKSYRKDSIDVSQKNISFVEDKNKDLNSSILPTSSGKQDAFQMSDIDRKRIFTAIHNSNRFGTDNKSSYLGEDSSVHRASAFDLYFKDKSDNKSKKEHSEDSVVSREDPKFLGLMAVQKLDSSDGSRMSLPIALPQDYPSIGTTGSKESEKSNQSPISKVSNSYSKGSNSYETYKGLLSQTQGTKLLDLPSDKDKRGEKLWKMLTSSLRNPLPVPLFRFINETRTEYIQYHKNLRKQEKNLLSQTHEGLTIYNNKKMKKRFYNSPWIIPTVIASARKLAAKRPSGKDLSTSYFGPNSLLRGCLSAENNNDEDSCHMKNMEGQKVYAETSQNNVISKTYSTRRYSQRLNISPSDTKYDLDINTRLSENEDSSTKNPCDGHYDPFTTYSLGPVWISSSVLNDGSSNFQELPVYWVKRDLLLKQNYLFEYSLHDGTLPIGYIHLQGASISRRLDDLSIVHIKAIINFYDCQTYLDETKESLLIGRITAMNKDDSLDHSTDIKSRNLQQTRNIHDNTLHQEENAQIYGSLNQQHHTTILIKAITPSQAEDWVRILSNASRLNISDLYEYIPISDNLNDKMKSSATSTYAEYALNKRLEKLSELGKGQFVVVRKARRRAYIENGCHKQESDEEKSQMKLEHHTSSSSSNSICALKIVKKSGFWERVLQMKERNDTVTREILSQSILTSYWHELQRATCRRPTASVNNPRDKELNVPSGKDSYDTKCPIVQIFSVFETEDDLVMEIELMSKYDAFDELSTFGILEERKTAAIVYQLVRGAQFCKSMGIAHRDIKLSNIIFPQKRDSGKRLELTDDSDTSKDIDSKTESFSYFQDVEIRLADFGMAGFISPESDTLRGRCGTPGYVAPEILKAQTRDAYPSNVDMFSIGVVAYTLLCGYEPFYGQNDRDLIKSNRQAIYEFHLPEWKDVSNEAKDLVSKLMQVNPLQRLYPEQALKHPWLAEFCSSLVEVRPVNQSSLGERSDEKEENRSKSTPSGIKGTETREGYGKRDTDYKIPHVSSLSDFDDNPFLTRTDNPCVIM